MSNETNSLNQPWPLPKFSFSVDFGLAQKNIAFQEISGMEAETQIIEYRKSNSPLFSNEKMPGLKKYGNVVMKRGIFVKDNTFWDWYSQITMNTTKRMTIVIRLLDESGLVTMQWRLDNAWPTKITATDLKSDGNEVAIDTIEITYENLEITNE